MAEGTHSGFASIASIAVTAAVAIAQQAIPPALAIPAFCGYAHPDAEAMRRDPRTGAVPECRGELVFYVELTAPGELQLALARTPGAARAAVDCDVAPHPGEPLARTHADLLANAERIALGTFALPRAGMHRITLRSADDAPLRALQALQLDGPAAAGAKACTVERRNAASVHLWYEVPAAHRDDVEWFYCELTPHTDPLWSYYMATGFARGYFGMQVNSPTERRLIFSVWDSGNEGVDRDKVAAEDRVQLLAKGDGVVASGFGNEGTGGHSHLVHDWRIGATFRFLLHATPDGTHTDYTAWFGDAQAAAGRDRGWRLIASFRAPKDGRFLRGLYSFSENFGGANGDQLRASSYGNAWVRTHGGEWLPLLAATFTHDEHGAHLRPDRQGSVRDGRFELRHGDFATGATPRGTRLALPAPPGAPPGELPTEPSHSPR